MGSFMFYSNSWGLLGNFFLLADKARKKFVKTNFHNELSEVKQVEVNRATIYDDVIRLYSTQLHLVCHFPLRISFKGEGAIDFGGVGRDCFSAFWEEAYKKMFDGAALLAPATHATINLEEFSTLAKVLSHGYLCCGYLPTRIAYPVLAYVILGTSVSISEDIFVKSLSDFLSTVDQKVIADALEAKKFEKNLLDSLVNILSRFGCRDLPTPEKLRHILSSLAQHQFRSQPFAAISIMSGGIPEKHRQFWKGIHTCTRFS